jgi:prefoldin subunit 5
MNKFMGKDGYSWWIGVVEDRMDPLKMGRTRVRIFGYHTGNKELLPTKDLPWAQAVLPANGSQSFSSPKEGEFVTGYFLDDGSAQVPIVTGVIPGLKPATGGDAGFQDPRTPEQIAAAPKPPSGIVIDSIGQPTVPPIARSIVANTSQGAAANNRVHNCDICAELNKDVAVLKSKVMGFVKSLRLAAEGLFAGSASTPFVEEAKQKIKALRAKIKLIQKELKPIIDEIKAYQAYIEYLQKLIAYINSLPAELQKLYSQCLSEAMASLKQALSVSAALTDATNTLNAAVSEAETAISTATSAASGEETPVTPEIA